MSDRVQITGGGKGSNPNYIDSSLSGTKGKDGYVKKASFGSRSVTVLTGEAAGYKKEFNRGSLIDFLNAKIKAGEIEGETEELDKGKLGFIGGSSEERINKVFNKFTKLNEANRAMSEAVRKEQDDQGFRRLGAGHAQPTNDDYVNKKGGVLKGQWGFYETTNQPQMIGLTKNDIHASNAICLNETPNAEKPYEGVSIKWSSNKQNSEPYLVIHWPKTPMTQDKFNEMMNEAVKELVRLNIDAPKKLLIISPEGPGKPENNEIGKLIAGWRIDNHKFVLGGPDRLFMDRQK